MKKIIFALTISLIPVFSFAQEWFPVGAMWTYSVAYPGTPNVGVVHTECIKDTLLNGVTAKVLVSEDLCSANYPENIFHYNPDTDILYYHVGNTFRTYYDFSKNPGESYYMYFPSFEDHIETYDSLLLTVDSTVVKSFAGIDVRCQYITCPTGADYHLGEFIMEYIGAISLYPVYGACDLDWLTELRCYHDQTFSYYAKPIYEEEGCDINLSIKELHPQNIMTIYPNPASEKLRNFPSTLS